MGAYTGVAVPESFAAPHLPAYDVVVARLEGEVTLKRYHRVDERHVVLKPKSTNPEHTPIRIDLKTDAFEIVGVAVGALIGDGFNRPEYDYNAA